LFSYTYTHTPRERKTRDLRERFTVWEREQKVWFCFEDFSAASRRKELLLYFGCRPTEKEKERGFYGYWPWQREGIFFPCWSRVAPVWWVFLVSRTHGHGLAGNRFWNRRKSPLLCWTTPIQLTHRKSRSRPSEVASSGDPWRTGLPRFSLLRFGLGPSRSALSLSLSIVVSLSVSHLCFSLSLSLDRVLSLGLSSLLLSLSATLSVSLSFSLCLVGYRNEEGRREKRRRIKRKSNEEGRSWRKERGEEFLKDKNNLPCKFFFHFYLFFLTKVTFYPS